MKYTPLINPYIHRRNVARRNDATSFIGGVVAAGVLGLASGWIGFGYLLHHAY